MVLRDKLFIEMICNEVVLNELDQQLGKRGLRFVRYADDCIIAVRSEASAKCVMYLITDWIERKLSLKVNAEKMHNETAKTQIF